MNELALIAIGAFLSLASSLASGVVFFWLRSHREDFRDLVKHVDEIEDGLDDKIQTVDVKANENRESIARLEGRFGRLGTQQNWRE